MDLNIEQIKELLFNKSEEKVTNTVYFNYLIANKAKEYFKKLIEEKDISGEYSRISYVDEAPNEDLEAELKKYKDQIRAVDEGMKEWEASHSEYFRIQPSLPSSGLLKPLFDVKEQDWSLEELTQGYKAAHDFIKSVNDSDLDPFCIDEKKIINYEFRPLQSEERDLLMKMHKVPTRKELKETLPKKKVMKRRMSLNRKAAEEMEPFNSSGDEGSEKL